MSNYMPPSRGDRRRQVAVAGLVAGGIVAGASGDYESGAESTNPLLPADGAFALWVPIYAGCLGYTAYQLMPSQAQREVHRKAGLPLAAAVALSGTWVWLQDPPTRQLPAIAATVVAATAAHRRATASVVTSADRWLVSGPTGLFSGWVALASLVAATEVGIASGWTTPPRPRAWVAAALGGVTLVGVRAGRTDPVPATYAAALAWGLAGIAAAARPRDPLRSVLAAAGSAAVLLSSVVRRGARDRPAGRTPS